MQQSRLYLRVPTDQFILGIDPPHRKRAGEFFDQRIQRKLSQRPLRHDRLSLGSGFPGDAEDPAFADKVSLVPLGPVPRAPP
ncbi:MAG: hypothetical protein ACK56I_02900 [bacterium]